MDRQIAWMLLSAKWFVGSLCGEGVQAGGVPKAFENLREAWNGES